MVMPGGHPKHPDDRIRRNAPIFDKIPVRSDGLERGPALPEDIGIFWCKRTKEWWDIWRNSPQSMVMHDTDWELMLETAILHNELWMPKVVWNKTTKQYDNIPKNASELKSLASEIRSRVSAFGASFEDRRKLRMDIQTPQSEAELEARLEAAAKDAVDYATMLNKKAAPKEK